MKGLPCGQDGQGRKQQALSGAIQQSLPDKRAGQAGERFANLYILNSGFFKIKILTQFKSNSLIEHITRTWRLVPEIGQYVDVVLTLTTEQAITVPAEAVQAASLSDVLDVHSSMAMFSPPFDFPSDVEARLMQIDPSAPDFAEQLAQLIGGRQVDAGRVRTYAEAIREAAVSNMPLGKPTLLADDFLPEKNWHVLASVGYMCDDPYTGAPGVTQVADNVYRVTTRLATRKASSRITFTLRLMKSCETTRQVFSPLLVRFLSGVDHTTRPVKISDSGRIRNELQTMISQALEHDGEHIRVHFDRINEMVMPPEKQAAIRKVLQWYKVNHPVWFEWLDVD